MKVIQRDGDGATIKFSNRDLGLLLSAGTEFTQGQYAPPTEDAFQDVIDATREEVMQLFESLVKKG